MADDQLPEDIIYGILSRLPVKSLARSRCVCKPWLEYIDHPYLKTIHLKQELTPIIFHHHQKQCTFSFLRVIEATSTVQNDPVSEFCCDDDYSTTLKVLGLCNGLTLVCFDTFNLAHINPLSKQRYDLPPVKISHDRNSRIDPYYLYSAGIGFDDSINSFYKTVCVVRKSVYRCSWEDVDVVQEHLCTLVHGSGASEWREIRKLPAYPITGAGVFSHGRMYWLADSQFWTPEEGTKVVWFDVKTEEFGLTEPPEWKEGHWVDSQLVDLSGEVGFAYMDRFRVELWILKGGEWVVHCGFDIDLSCDYVEAVPGWWNEEGDVLLTSDRGRRLMVYAPRTGELRRVGGLDDRCEGDVVMYRGSLFSMMKT
ncbi:hypothetical protein SSX86_019374 [Deinandra increscens subsp. villosa]|uniref:F-box domain-containing protein n=1 Tax=Deinandra increscens subsp. villosa TaxID=3103831 RepID=A0AAP0GSY7_9ASTR